MQSDLDRPGTTERDLGDEAFHGLLGANQVEHEVTTRIEHRVTVHLLDGARQWL
jgi:hypothetical protein